MHTEIVLNKVFLDTNTLIYQTFNDFDAEKHKIVNEKLSYFVEKEYSIFISTQILREFFAICTNGKVFKIPLTYEQAVSKVNEFIANFDVVYETNGIMTTLNSLIIKYKQDKQKVYDTNIVAMMIDNNIQKLFTFNTKDFKKFTEIELIGL